MFQPGQSGNPNGRPKGTVDKRHELRKILDEKAEALVRKAAEMALQGDAQMMRACLERLVPAYKAAATPAPTGEVIEGSLVEMGTKVMRALSAGDLTPDEAATLMQAISAQARIVEVDELARRLSELENRIGNQGKA